MSKPAAFVTGMHVCPMLEGGQVPHVGGPISDPGATTVLIGGQPALRQTDPLKCAVGAPNGVAAGSATVLIEGLGAARVGDPTNHGGIISLGFPMVLIGG